MKYLLLFSLFCGTAHGQKKDSTVTCWIKYYSYYSDNVVREVIKPASVIYRLSEVEEYCDGNRVHDHIREYEKRKGDAVWTVHTVYKKTLDKIFVEGRPFNLSKPYTLITRKELVE